MGGGGGTGDTSPSSRQDQFLFPLKSMRKCLGKGNILATFFLLCNPIIFKLPLRNQNFHERSLLRQNWHLLTILSKSRSIG